MFFVQSSGIPFRKSEKSSALLLRPWIDFWPQRFHRSVYLRVLWKFSLDESQLAKSAVLVSQVLVGKKKNQAAVFIVLEALNL